MIRSQKKLGEILLKKGLLTSRQIEAAIQEQVKTKEFIGNILVKSGQIKEEDLLAALSEQFNLSVTTLKDRYIDWKFVSTFSAELLLNYRCFPVRRKEDAVTVAITNPLDIWAIKKAEEETRGFKLELVLVPEKDMDEAVRRYQQYMRGVISRKLE